MKGWFDSFRQDGGPTLYSSERIPVTQDIINVTICVIFFSIFVAFLVIFPGIRKERFTTFISVTVSLFVGTVILVCIHGSDWHVAQSQIRSQYKSFSSHKLAANIGVKIGLNSVNVTLKGNPVNNTQKDASSHYSLEGIAYNERFHWFEVDEMEQEYRAALIKGLPYPILTIAECLSLNSAGLSWGRYYRIAGYYSYIILWTTFAIWLVMNILFCLVPRYGAYAMIVVGNLLFLTNVLYLLLLPKRSMKVYFEGGVLQFTFGWCYWLALSAGGLCLVLGCSIVIVDLTFPDKFSTILEVDYDSPSRLLFQERKDSFLSDSRRSSDNKLPMESKGSVQNSKCHENIGYQCDGASTSTSFYQTVRDAVTNAAPQHFFKSQNSHYNDTRLWIENIAS